MAGSGDRWRWTDQYGNQRLVHQDELRAALAGGTLPPYTLVWRAGMPAWLHAHDVPELMAMASGVVLNIPPPPLDVIAVQAEFEHRTVDVARDGEKVAAEEPPSPPLEKYTPYLSRPSMPPMPSVRAVALAAAHVADDEAKTRVAEPASPAVAAAAAAAHVPDDEAKTRVAEPVAPVVAAAAAHVADDEAKTWVAKPASESQPVRIAALPPLPATHLVSPPPVSRKSLQPSGGAGLASLPPPPPVVPAEGSAASASGPSTEAPDRFPPAPPLPSSDLMGISSGEHRRSGLSSEDELPSFPLESESSAFDSVVRTVRSLGSRVWAGVARGARQIGRTSRDVVAKVGPAVAEAKEKLGDPKEIAADAKEKLRDPKARLAAGLGALALVVFIVLVIVVIRSCGSTEAKETGSRRASVGAPAARAGNTPAAAVARNGLAACAISKESTRVAPRASKDVPIEVAVSRGEPKAFVGFAADSKSALGLSLDTSSLVAKSEFSANAAGKLRGVVPIAGPNRTAFTIDADGPDDKLQGSRTVAGDAPVVVGYAGGGIAIAAKASDEPKRLWPLDGDDPVEALRAIALPDRGYAVVFRRRGEIFAGLVDRNRAARGPLGRVTGAQAPAGAPVGAPSIAFNGTSIAVAFADRAAATDPWEIRLGMAAAPAVLPAGTKRFQIPGSGAGQAAMAPALAGLPDGRWILVWTGGTGGDYAVQGQTLGADLAPIGAAFTVSKPGANAGQAAVAVGSESGVIAYLSQAGDGYQLWTAAIGCR